MKQVELAGRLLDVLETDVVPLTRDGVAVGNKVFGAAILRKSDLALIVAATNNEVENPLWHGEVHTLKKFYEISSTDRPDTADCVFLSTHEPCSLCLSAITWAGFDNFYYLFSYADTENAFQIPHDLKILEEVFGVSGGAYRRQNAFWTARSISELFAETSEGAQAEFERRVQALNEIYAAMSADYQSEKKSNEIPLK